jgi:hypothetical protein
LAEPRSPFLDNVAKKDYTDPPYVDALAASGVPWTCRIVCPQFGEDEAPFLEDLLMRTTVHGFIAAFPSFVPQAFVDYKPNADVIFSNKNPYVRSFTNDAVMDRKSVTMMCRVSPNKGGWTSLCAVLEQLPAEGWTYDIFGVNMKGLGSSMIVRLINALANQYGQKSLTWHGPNEKWGPCRMDPFTMVLKTGHTVQYHGGYLDCPLTAWQPRVVLNVSSASFTMGTLEQVGLEALDAGCALVTAPHLIAGDDAIYDCFVADGYRENAVIMGPVNDPAGFCAKRREPRDALVSLAHRILDAQHEDPIYAAQRKRNNWAALAKYHEPAAHARLLLAALKLGELPAEYEQRHCSANDVARLVEYDVLSERRWNPYVTHQHKQPHETETES